MAELGVSMAAAAADEVDEGEDDVAVDDDSPPTGACVLVDVTTCTLVATLLDVTVMTVEEASGCGEDDEGTTATGGDEDEEG